MKALNLGCGSRYHPDWENVDFVPSGTAVKSHDLRRGVPYPDSSFDVVYHSHVLEHFSKQEGVRFVRECFRVLRSGGIIRVAVPDLERIVRLYLESLERAVSGDEAARHNYDWMILEMYDQSVRVRVGGECAEYLRQDSIPNWEFILERWGIQAQLTLDYARKQSKDLAAGTNHPRTAWQYVVRNPFSVLRHKLVRVLLGPKDWAALEVGRFRQSGEVHMWMYDSYSLSELLNEVGFVNSSQRSATDSQIPGWASYNLDSEPTGKAYKPDSIYVEATKP